MHIECFIQTLVLFWRFCKIWKMALTPHNYPQNSRKYLVEITAVKMVKPVITFNGQVHFHRGDIDV